MERDLCTLCGHPHNVHKERNVCDHLPERERPWMRAELRAAWTDTDHAAAMGSLTALAAQLARCAPTRPDR